MDVDVNKKGVFDIFLLVVCKFGYVSVVKCLLRLGVNVNMFGRFSLFFIVVCFYGFVDIVKIFL